MTLTIPIPVELEAALRDQFGAALESRAALDLAATWFAGGKISSRQVAAMLGISLFEAHALLKAKGAHLPMSIDDVEADLASLRAMHGK